MIATTEKWTSLCARADLTDEAMHPFEVNDRHVVLYVSEGEVYATTNVCSHAFALLSEGWFEEGLVECPLHAAQFDIRTGEVVVGPADCAIETFPVRTRDGIIEVLLSEDGVR